MKSLSKPKLLLHFEGLAVLLLAGGVYHELAYSWGTFALWFLAPDLLMLGFLFGNKVGAHVYNAGHTYALPLAASAILYYAHKPDLFPLCLIWFAHIGFDRFLGYGLKYETAFKDTHLNRV